MFGNTSTGSSISFSGILGGVSKALNVANQVIPLYQKAQPIIKNARSVIDVVKNISLTDSKDKKSNISTEIIDPDSEVVTKTNGNLVFFQ